MHEGGNQNKSRAVRPCLKYLLFLLTNWDRYCPGGRYAAIFSLARSTAWSTSSGVIRTVIVFLLIPGMFDRFDEFNGSLVLCSYYTTNFDFLIVSSSTSPKYLPNSSSPNTTTSLSVKHCAGPQDAGVPIYGAKPCGQGKSWGKTGPNAPRNAFETPPVVYC